MLTSEAVGQTATYKRADVQRSAPRRTMDREVVIMGKASASDQARIPMTPKAASRVQSAAARNPSGKSATSGFAPRAQSAAAKSTGSGRRDSA